MHVALAFINPLQKQNLFFFLNFDKKVLNFQLCKPFTAGEANHDDEEVARVVFRDIVARKLNDIRTDYQAE